jgi:oligosaccharyltransferase complex subunit beta
VLVAAVQGENNARAVLLADGGRLLSDDAWAMTASRAAHDSATRTELLCASLLSWVSQRSGVLRAVNMTELRPDGTAADLLHPPRQTPDLPRSQFPRPETFVNERAFRVGEEVVVQVTLQQRVRVRERVPANESAVSDQWQWSWDGFEASDAQVEVVMLDPFVRAPLVHRGGGLHTARLRLPDQWGVFKFRLQYRRAGWSTLALSDTVTLRPLDHTEFERYIVAAAPHYVAAGACALLMVVLAGVVLTTSNTKSKAA